MHRKILVAFGGTALIALLGSCTDGGTATSSRALPAEGGARLLPLSGTTSQLGSSDRQASPGETPGWTRFRHDVWMDTNEVSQAEFQALLSRNPSSTPGDALPVTNVSWFDAILCANARSKRDHFDTVYEYGAVSIDKSGSTLDIQGLSTHFERNGWRLPTEAEWEAAARAGSAAPYIWGSISDSSLTDDRAWYSRNSKGSIHPTGAKLPNGWGIHDMAGNAMEWVSDWKGPFPKDTLDDYAGLDAPADIPEVALKGGAYNYGISSLRPSARSATYPAYRSSRAEYVGFRLARGIMSPTFGSSSGQAISAPPVSILSPDLAATLGTTAARLVFLNRSKGKGLLSWIDFAEATPVVRALPDKDPAFHPAISPDGRWVVWSTALEGSTGPSRIKARKLARNDTVVLDLGEGAIPRWSIVGTDTFVVRAGALDNTRSGWSATTTTARKWSSSGELTGNAQTWAQGSYHDGRSGPFLYTGYRQLRQYDTRAGSSRILFTAPQNGKAAGDTSQACNASAAPDSSGRVMFLDFGYTDSSKVVGHSYGIHQVGFISDSSGNIVGLIPIPTSENQWDHLEWSNQPRWAVSSALDANEAAHAVYLLDIQSGTSTRILAGTDLWQPALWMDHGRSSTPDTSFALDSVGQYNSPGIYPSQEDLAAKTALFWGLEKDSLRIALLGHSRAESGLLPRSLSFPAFNFGAWGNLELGVSHILGEYVLPRCPKLRAVVLSFDAGQLFIGESTVWNAFAGSMGYQYDARHKFWTDTLPPVVQSTLRSRSWPLSAIYDSLGEVHYPASGWGGDPPESNASGDYNLTDPAFLANWNRLDSLVHGLTSKGLQVFLVEFPQSPAYKSTPFAGKYGPPWETYTELLARVHAWETTNPKFHFVDFYQGGHHDFNDSEAINEDHLAYPGALRLTARLDSVLLQHLSP